VIHPLFEVLCGSLSFVSARALPDEGGQVLHHRPVIIRAFPRNPLQRIDATQAHLKLVAAKLLNGLGEAFRDAALLICSGLFLMSSRSGVGLPEGDPNLS
jgi:hypothetical protein